MNLLLDKCSSAFAAGDMAYFSSAGCAQAVANDALVSSKQKEINVKTVLLVGVGLLAAGTMIYLFTKSKT